MTYERSLYRLMTVVMVALAVVGVFCQGADSTLEGFLRLQRQPARLLSDFTITGGTGAALVNSAVVGAVGLGMVYKTDIRLSGPTFSAILTMMGFALFGKTALNILPIIVGVYLAAKIVGKPFSAYILIAMFGTALGPLVTFLVYEAGLVGVPAFTVGILAGIATGMLLPALAIAMLHLHQGYHLYNVGLAAGFFGLFAAAFLTAGGRELPVLFAWNTRGHPALSAVVPVLSLVFILWGIFQAKGGTLRDLLQIQRLSGRLPSDFLDSVSPGGALVNVGLLGLASCLYVVLAGADFNGPVLGAVFTIMGFGAFGKTLRNCWPVIAGVVLSCLAFGKVLSAPGPILAALFSTTLAPLAGAFGPLTGIVAGFIHLVVVERTAAWHCGLALYNNGFAGGLTSALMVAVIEWYRSNRRDR